MKKVTHIFFDLDDTLWDIRTNTESVLRDMFGSYGLDEKLKVPFGTFFERYREINVRYWTLYGRREANKEELRTRRFYDTFLSFGYDNFNENLDFAEAFSRVAPHGKALKDGCIETLEELRKKYCLNIITNGFKETQGYKIDAGGIRHYFDDIIISEEHGLFKPEAAIFRLAEQRAGVAAENCLMVGDNYEADVEGALAAGWHAVWLNQEPSGSALTICSLRDLAKLL
jgi:putative hydrolase of the HAD superfamily